MDIKTFKDTLDSLVRHHCIELLEPAKGQKNVFDNTRIKMKRGLKNFNDKYIEFYYSTARAFISKQITQNEFKVFLCIVNNIRDSKSCTIEDIDRILGIGRAHVIDAIKNLQSAQAKSQGIKQLMAGGGVVLIGLQLIPLLSGLFS